MENIITINSTKATYIDRFHSSTNYNKSDNLIAGIINKRNTGCNIYRTILNFNINDVNPDMIASAYLFIFVDKMRFSQDVPLNISILGNYENIDFSTLSWDSFPNDGFTKTLQLNLPKNAIDSYIKIDVTSIIKDLSQFDINYNLIFTPTDTNANIIISFSSINSTNLPYLKLELNKEQILNSELDENHNENIDKENDIFDDSKNISKNLILENNIIENLSTKIDSQNDLLNSIKDIATSTDLNNINNLILDLNKIIEVNNNNLNSINNSISDLVNNNHFDSDFLTNIQEKEINFDNNINTIIKNIDLIIPSINSIKNNLNNNSVVHDIELTNESIMELKNKLDLQDSNLESVKSELINEIKNTNLLSDAISNLSTIDDIATLKEILNNTTNLISNNTLKIESINTSNDNYYKSICNSIENLNNKFSSFESLNSKFELFEKNSEALSEKYLDLNSEILTLKNMSSNISKNLDIFEKDIANLNNSLLELNSSRSNDIDLSNNTDVNSINSRLNVLSKDVEKIIDIISSLTIEPLN